SAHRLSARPGDLPIAPRRQARGPLSRRVREISAGQVGEMLVVDLATESKLFRLQVAVGRAEALHRICAAVIDTSNPQCLPSREAVLAQPLARYETIAAFEAAKSVPSPLVG